MSVLTLELSDSQARRVSRLLASETACLVMDAVAEESKSESALSKELGVALSTVHYNVQRLVDAGLLVSDEFSYSEKGKEVRYYRLASEHIVISAKPSVVGKEVLVGGIVGLFVAGVVAFTQKGSPQPELMMAADSAMESARSASAVADPVVWPWVLLGVFVVVVCSLVAGWLFRR